MLVDSLSIIDSRSTSANLHWSFLHPKEATLRTDRSELAPSNVRHFGRHDGHELQVRVQW